MLQRFNRSGRSWILEWLGHVGRCLYFKGQVQVLQAWQTWDPILAPHCTAAGITKAVRRFGTMPMLVKMAVTEMHRCDSCVMWQARAGYSKHLENRSLSSLHWKYRKLTMQESLLVLHFAILHLARTRVEWDGPIVIPLFMVGFRSAVQGVLPILFPSHMPRIGNFLFHPYVMACALASWQHSKFISLRLVRKLPQTNGASGSRLTSSTIPIHFRVFKTMPMHKNWCKTGRDCISQSHSWKLAAYLLRTFASSFEGATAMVNFGMAEVAALIVWLHWMRCQSFRTALDRMAESRCKYDGDCGCLKDSWYSTSDGWRKRLRVDGKPSRKVCQNGCYRLASLWFWWAATSAWWTFKTSWKYFTFMFALGAGQIDPESTAGHAICDNSLGHQQKCLYIPVEITQEDLCHQFVVTTRVLTTCALTERPGPPPPKPYTKVSQVSGINKKRPLTKRPWPYVAVKHYDPLFAIMYCVGWFGHCIL